VFTYLQGKSSSLLKLRLKKLLTALGSKEGRHTELISLYVPPDRQISDVMNNLRQEQSTATNIKSRTTKKNVLDALEKVMQQLRLFHTPPENGLVIFSGAIPQNGAGSEKIETYVLEPPEPISLYYYRCDQQFHLDPLTNMLTERDTYGIVVIDGNETTIATLRGRTLDIIERLTSGLPPKHRAGGQSQRRFERLREAEVNEYYKRIGRHLDDIFLSIPDLKGILVGGPGPTKEYFLNGEHFHYTLRDKVLQTVATSYTGENGVKEVVEKSSETLSEVRYFEEKKLLQAFLYELGHDTGLATYGEDEVRKALSAGMVKTLLLSEGFTERRVSLRCSNCQFTTEESVHLRDLQDFEGNVENCPNCQSPNYAIDAIQDVVEELAELAIQTGAEVEIISTQTEAGKELDSSFGGVAAILRYSFE
jgi:peptide chain release factor subunit 1